ncbi:hypothetical protein IB236_08565 [Acidovorax sp. ACV02]|uniref:hypothetical protein n=1 Tax=Acidovorax sp. ACV02 TaxID=2769310 RepID=UPI001781E935|nr:hypothetical protein [Acidovorax sp. ACV02]MBD9405385.1 hypothetical protein [Acidovorax sp. ACV02]
MNFVISDLKLKFDKPENTLDRVEELAGMLFEKFAPSQAKREVVIERMNPEFLVFLVRFEGLPHVKPEEIALWLGDHGFERFEINAPFR